VAVRRDQHSGRFGQRAFSQTVSRPRSSRSVCVKKLPLPRGSSRFNHPGSRPRDGFGLSRSGSDCMSQVDSWEQFADPSRGRKGAGNGSGVRREAELLPACLRLRLGNTEQSGYHLPATQNLYNRRSAPKTPRRGGTEASVDRRSITSAHRTWFNVVAHHPCRQTVASGENLPSGLPRARRFPAVSDFEANRGVFPFTSPAFAF